jgi:hypothetical protein
MYCIKLTDENGKTRAGEDSELQWGPGVRHEASGPLAICSNGLHYYQDSISERRAIALALLRNPADANFANPHAWRCVPAGEVVVDTLKCCSRGLTTVEGVSLPVVTTEQRVEVAIRCALAVCEDGAWRAWAENWLNGTDRTAAAARAAWAAARAAAEAAAWAAEWAAEWAAAAAAAAAARAAMAAMAAGVDVSAIAGEVFYRNDE